MSKLPPTPANIRFVADTLAQARRGERDQVTLADVRVTIAGTAAVVEPHFKSGSPAYDRTPRRTRRDCSR